MHKDTKRTRSSRAVRRVVCALLVGVLAVFQSMPVTATSQMEKEKKEAQKNWRKPMKRLNRQNGKKMRPRPR